MHNHEIRGVRLKNIRGDLGHTGGLKKPGTNTFIRNRDILCVLLLILACMAFCWLFVLQYGVFGSKVDWINQHSVIPDYFRRRFYETGSLLPDFAWNIGGGQNIYHLSYYGLFSPVVLLSFLFPFIRMDYYIMGSSILSYIASVLLFYRFLRRKEMTRGICFGTSLLFSLAASMIYQSYNQLMFINYMPFLCLSLIGTDDYLKRQKRGWLLAGTAGMILTSFYFSIGGMLALCLYAVSEYLNMADKAYFFPMLKKGICYVGILLQGILLCGILLVPAAVSIFSSRQENAAKAQITSLLSFDPLKILYTPYGMGLSVLAIAAVLGGIFCASRWQERVLPVALTAITAVPAVGFLLNGGLYDKQKVFIPFLPLVCLQCGRYVSHKFCGIVREVLPWALTGLLLYLTKYNQDFDKYLPLAWADYALACLCYLLPVFISAAAERILHTSGIRDGGGDVSGTRSYGRRGGLLWNKAFPVFLLSVSCLFLFCYDIKMHPYRERMIAADKYKNVIDSQKVKSISDTLNGDDSFYRLEEISGDGETNHNNVNRIADIRQNITSMYSSCYNKEYWNFRKNTYTLNEPFRNNMMQSATDNPCFLQFMGVKYILYDGQAAGYGSVKNSSLLKNSSVAPVLYVTDQVVGEGQYRRRSFPTNQTALLHYAVVPDGKAGSVSNLDTDMAEMQECSIRLPECDTPQLTVKKTADGYEIRAKADIKKELQITGESGRRKGNLFALVFDVENKRPDSDMHVRVNGQTNRLTAVSHEYANQNTNFTFVISKKENQDKISIELSDGNYKIRNVKAFTGNLSDFQNPALYRNPVVLEKGRVNSSLKGSVDVSENGYLITSIPYDNNFKIILDGEEIDILKVNIAFLGAEIPAGRHTVELIYHAPGKGLGLMLTIAGILTLIVPFALQNIFRKRKMPE